MPKNRERQRANRRIARKNQYREELLSKRNEYGFSDPTPCEAIKAIRKQAADK